MTRKRAPQGGKVLDADFRHARARAANFASRQSVIQRRDAIAAQFTNKGDAYQAGYRTGYQQALHWLAYRLKKQARA